MTTARLLKLANKFQRKIGSKPDWDKLLRGYNVIMDWYLYREDAQEEEIEVPVVLAGEVTDSRPGRSWGHPDHQYPEEHGGTETLAVFDARTGKNIDLTKEEEVLAETALWEKFQENKASGLYFDPPDYD